ncbi:MAG: hypothetical protein COB02_09705 [Candidatus Cloacimonadota bacterium]|nr:MAG: hypothetical protein COB02_09705 [Candidatus Cloacimonadota bacterium]
MFEAKPKGYEEDSNRSKKQDIFLETELQNGRYIIEKQIGEGFSSVVKLATDTQARGRKVAIKMIDLNDDSIDGKLLKESLRLVKLKHKGLPIFFGEWQSDDKSKHYIVTEYSGITLGSYCKNLKNDKNFNSTQLNAIFLQILDVFEYIHNQDLIHLDLKPDNILIDPESLDITVIDFGLARKVVEKKDISESYLKVKMANHDYASPEVRKNGNVSKLSDIYSLGAILYFLSHDFIEPPSIPDKDDFLFYKTMVFKAMKGLPSRRYQSVVALREAFLKNDSKIVFHGLIAFCVFVLVLFALSRDSNKVEQAVTSTSIQVEQKKPHVNEPSFFMDKKVSDSSMSPEQIKAPNVSLPLEEIKKLNSILQEPIFKKDIFKQVKLLMKQSESILLKDKPRDAYSLYLSANSKLSSLIGDFSNSVEIQSLINGERLLNNKNDEGFQKRLGELKTLSKNRVSKIELQAKTSRHNRLSKGLKNDAYIKLRAKDYDDALKALDKLKRDYYLSDIAKSILNGSFRLLGKNYNQIKKGLKPSNGEIYKDALSGVDFVYVPSGSFMMGSPKSEERRFGNEGPVHKVKISKGFYLGKFEVTQKQYKKIMLKHKSYFKGDNLPVEQVSHDDIRAYLKILNKKSSCNYTDTIKAIDEGHLSDLKSGCYRLPTEAEWEYSARGGTSSVFSFGDSLDSTQANFDGRYPYGGASKGKYLRKTSVVGSYKKNSFGLYDMHGNVWEWVQDYRGSDYSKSSPNIDIVNVKKDSFRVLRGGSWVYSRFLRSASRYYNTSDIRFNALGFRLLVVR